MRITITPDTAAQQRAAQQAQLRTWAEGSGSARLRALIEEEHRAWLVVAEDEYLDAYTPPGYSVRAPEWPSLGGGPMSVRQRTKPQLADIMQLRALRALVAASEGVLRDPAMCWVVTYRPADEYDEDGDEDGQVVDRRYAATSVRVAAPTGKTRQVLCEVTD